MRKTLNLCMVLIAALLLPAFMAGGGAKLKIPKKVNAIIQDKCYGCHSPEGKSKDKLNWDELRALPQPEQLKKLEAIRQVLEEGAMPPKRFVERNPAKQLTGKETVAMKKWVAKALKKLSK